jgi:hypothetical protein
MFGLFKKNTARPSGVSYGHVALLVRYGASHAASRCSRAARSEDFESWSATLLEFINFYSTIACNEVCRKLESNSFETVSDAFKNIVHRLVQEPQAPQEIAQALEVVNRAYQNLKIDGKLFGQYWSGDLKSLVTSSDLEQMQRMDMPIPGQDAAAKAYYALLIRVLNIYNKGDSELPPVAEIALFDQTIKDVSAGFIDTVTEVIHR